MNQCYTVLYFKTFYPLLERHYMVHKSLRLVLLLTLGLSFSCTPAQETTNQNIYLLRTKYKAGDFTKFKYMMVGDGTNTLIVKSTSDTGNTDTITTTMPYNFTIEKYTEQTVLNIDQDGNALVENKPCSIGLDLGFFDVFSSFKWDGNEPEFLINNQHIPREYFTNKIRKSIQKATSPMKYIVSPTGNSKFINPVNEMSESYNDDSSQEFMINLSTQDIVFSLPEAPVKVNDYWCSTTLLKLPPGINDIIQAPLHFETINKFHIDKIEKENEKKVVIVKGETNSVFSNYTVKTKALPVFLKSQKEIPDNTIEDIRIIINKISFRQNGDRKTEEDSGLFLSSQEEQFLSLDATFEVKEINEPPVRFHIKSSIKSYSKCETI